MTTPFIASAAKVRSSTKQGKTSGVSPFLLCSSSSSLSLLRLSSTQLISLKTYPRITKVKFIGWNKQMSLAFVIHSEGALSIFKSQSMSIHSIVQKDVICATFYSNRTIIYANFDSFTVFDIISNSVIATTKLNNLEPPLNISSNADNSLFAITFTNSIEFYSQKFKFAVQIKQSKLSFASFSSFKPALFAYSLLNGDIHLITLEPDFSAILSDTKMHTLECHAEELAWSPHNRFLMVSASNLDKKLVLYDVEKKVAVKTIVLDINPSGLSFHGDGIHVAAISATGKIVVVDLSFNGKNGTQRTDITLNLKEENSQNTDSLSGKASVCFMLGYTGSVADADLNIKSAYEGRKTMDFEQKSAFAGRKTMNFGPSQLANSSLLEKNISNQENEINRKHVDKVSKKNLFDEPNTKLSSTIPLSKPSNNLSSIVDQSVNYMDMFSPVTKLNNKEVPVKNIQVPFSGYGKTVNRAPIVRKDDVKSIKNDLNDVKSSKNNLDETKINSQIKNENDVHKTEELTNSDIKETILSTLKDETKPSGSTEKTDSQLSQSGDIVNEHEKRHVVEKPINPSPTIPNESKHIQVKTSDQSTNEISREESKIEPGTSNILSGVSNILGNNSLQSYSTNNKSIHNSIEQINEKAMKIIDSSVDKLGTSLHEQTNEQSNPVSTFSQKLLESTIDEALFNFRDDLRREILDIHIEMIRLFEIQKYEVSAMIRDAVSGSMKEAVCEITENLNSLFRPTDN